MVRGDPYAPVKTAPHEDFHADTTGFTPLYENFLKLGSEAQSILPAMRFLR